MAKKQMWLGIVLTSCRSAQPLLLALMDKGGSPRKKGNAYIVLAGQRLVCAWWRTVPPERRRCEEKLPCPKHHQAGGIAANMWLSVMEPFKIG